MAGVAKIFARDRDSLALDLVGPARIVAIAGDGEREVRGQRYMVRLAVVQSFKTCKLLGVFFNQVCKAVQQAAAIGSRHLSPWAFKGAAGGLYSLVNIGRIGFRDLADFLSGRGIERGKRFSRQAVDPLIVDRILVCNPDSMSESIRGRTVVTGHPPTARFRCNKFLLRYFYRRACRSARRHPSCLSVKPSNPSPSVRVRSTSAIPGSSAFVIS